MTFDPTFNYGESDLSNDENILLWNFGELIKNLVTLSNPVERQSEIIGIGLVCDEMAIDFDTYFTYHQQNYLDKKLLNELQVENLKELNKYFDELSGNKSPEFWDDSKLGDNQDWKIVREKAKDILKSLEMQDLTLIIDRTEQYEITDKGKQVTIQTTKTKLVKTNAS